MNQTTTLDRKLPTILIVDDTPANIGVIAENLEERGYRILVAQDGAEGLQRAEFANPDLILLDVMMPELDGFEVCRRLKKRPATRDIPVIFMTARAETDDKVAGLAAGAVDYVTKPLQIEEVIARVNVQLNLSDMQKRLEVQNAQLQRYREQLEQRVAERTMELSTANQRLRAEIQERKQAQQELAAREREFRTLVENAPDEIARHDRQARFFYINPQHEKTLGITLADLAGKTPMECFPGIPDVAAYQALLMEVIETGRTAEYEVALPDNGDGPSYHSVLLVAERGADGEIVGALAIGRDITQQKRADAAIRERELRYRQLFENSPISIWEEDFSAVHSYFNELRQAGVEDLAAHFDAQPDALGHCAELVRIVDVNQAAVALHRAQSKAELFAGLAQTFTPDSFRAFREELIGLWRGETEMKVDATVQTLAGELRHVAVQFSIAPDTGNPWSRMLVSLVDITERKQAEQQLAMLGAAIDHAHEAAYFVDEQGGLFYVNEEASRMLGYSREALLGMTVMDIAPGWTPQVMADSWQEIIKVGAITIEAEHRHKDGRIIPVEINITHMKYGGRAFNLAMARDITERKRAERELHLLNHALDNAFDATYLVDADMRLRYVNEAAVRALGYSREELLAMTLRDIDPNLKPDMLKALMVQTSALGRFPGIIETQHRRKDGSVFPIEIGATVFDYEGERLHLTTVRDVTERKQAEEALLESEQRYREIFDNAVEGMYLLEVTEDGRFRNIEINPALVASTGIPREAMIGKFVDETVPEEAGRQIVEKYRRCVAAGTTIEEEIVLDLPAGHRHYLSTITPIYSGGRIHRLIGISRDISVLKQAERELQESREQLRGLTARREAAREEERKYIAREVHDELGQVLTGLQLNISVLEHKFAPGLPPLREHLKETKALTDRALGVARNVASALRPAALDLGINSALEWLTGRFSTNTGIQCKVHVSEDDIHIDENHATALFRIVQESLTNIARHAQADRVDVIFGKDGEDYLLSVRDNGKGFETDSRKLDSYGLVGIKERALMLGGTVSIESKPGKGTQISVRIPINRQGAEI